MVIDCNVFTSALCTRDESSPPARILALALQGVLNVVLSDTLLAEFREVANRPKLRARHGKNAREIAVLIAKLVTVGTLVVADEHASEGPDPGDAFLWPLLRVIPGTVLITGDRALLEEGPEWATVLSPRDWVERYDHE